MSKKRFNPATIDISDRSTAANVWRTRDESDRFDETRLLYSWSPSFSNDEERPAWSELPPRQRSVLLTKSMIQEVTKDALIQPWMGGTTKLPCGPYEFEADGGELTISKGAFWQVGTKKEWQDFIKVASEHVEKLPEGIDVSDVTIRCSASATANYTVELTAATILENDDHFNGDTERFDGTIEELEQAIEDAVRWMDSDNFDVEDAEYGTLNYDATEDVDLNDLSSDLRDVEGG